MKISEVVMWGRAASLAESALGRKVQRDDPLAWWCLTECIMSFYEARRGRRALQDKPDAG